MFVVKNAWKSVTRNKGRNTIKMIEIEGLFLLPDVFKGRSGAMKQNQDLPGFW